VPLAESQNKKAAFLQETVRLLGIQSKVHSGRAETVRQTFDCVILRAVDKMPKAVAAAAKLVAKAGWLALMTTITEHTQLEEAAGAAFRWDQPLRMPNSDSRILALGCRLSSPI